MALVRGESRMRVAVASAGIAVGAGLAVALLGPTERQLLVAAIGLAVGAPLVWSATRGTMDILEPLPWALAAMALMFVVRPIVDAATGYAFRGIYDVTPQFDAALGAGLVATLALVVGYRLPIAGRTARRLPAIPEVVDAGVTVELALALVVVGAAGYAIYAARAGSAFLDLVASGFVANQPVSTAYFYLAPFMAFPALLLLLQRTFINGVPLARVAIAILVLGFATVLAPASQRLWLLLLLAPFGVYPMLRSGYRPRIALIMGGLLIAVPVLVSMRDLRPGQGLDAWVGSLQRVAANPAEAYYQFASGPDTEMFDGLALGMQVVPAQLGFQPFSSLTSLLFHPIPRELWREKPSAGEGQVTRILFPDVQPGAATVAHSVVGNFYYDGWLFGVALGMLAVGFGLRVLYAYYLAHAENDQVRLVYASALPLVIVLFRGNLPDTFARALFTVVPLILVFAAAGKRTRGASARPVIRARPSTMGRER